MSPEQKAEFEARFAAENEQVDPEFAARMAAEDAATREKMVNPTGSMLLGSGAALALGRIANLYGKGTEATLEGLIKRYNVPEDVVSKGSNAVINYIRSQHTGDISYVGGEDYKRAHALTERAKELSEKAPLGYKYDFQAGQYIPEDEFNKRQAARDAVERARIAAERKNLPAVVRIAEKSPGTARAVLGAENILRGGLPPFAGRTIAGGFGGYSGAEAYNRAMQGDVPGAVISGTGAVGSALSLSPDPKKRAIGIGSALLSAIADRLYTSPTVESPGALDTVKNVSDALFTTTPTTTRAAGGAIPGYAKGEKVVSTGLSALKKAFAPAESKATKLSEGLAPFEQGSLRVTFADRMGIGDGRKGGPGFPGLQLTDPEHAKRQAAWMVDAQNIGTMLARSAQQNPKTVFSNVLAAPTAHHSNRQVYADLQDAYFKMLDRGEVDPKWIEKANQLIPKLTVGKDKAPLFPQPFDVRDKFAVQELVDTFDRRGALSNMFAGERTGGAKGAMPFYSKIVESYADPMVKNAPTYSVGNRLFTLTGEAPEKVTDLHPAYDWMLKGKDLGVHFQPVPQEIALPDFYRFMQKEKGRKPSTFEYTRGYPRSQNITEEYLTHLQKEGFAKGGLTE